MGDESIKLSDTLLCTDHNNSLLNDKNLFLEKKQKYWKNKMMFMIIEKVLLPNNKEMFNV